MGRRLPREIPFPFTFGLVAFSKMLDMMARNASREADRLDKLEAPAKELAQQQKRDEDARAAQEAARSINKPKFHPQPQTRSFKGVLA